MKAHSNLHSIAEHHGLEQQAEERCAKRMDICLSRHPEKTTEGTHSILCHLYGEQS